MDSIFFQQFSSQHELKGGGSAAILITGTKAQMEDIKDTIESAERPPEMEVLFKVTYDQDASKGRKEFKNLLNLEKKRTYSIKYQEKRIERLPEQYYENNRFCELPEHEPLYIIQSRQNYICATRVSHFS